MKESTGSIASIYIIIFFIIIMFGFVISMFNYYKSYKVNNSITAIIEDYGGFNRKSMSEIDKRLKTLGYNRDKITCKAPKDNEKLLALNGDNINMLNGKSNNLGYKGYCVYLVDESNDGKYTYYSYKISTYLIFNFGIFNLKIPYQMTTNTVTMYNCYGSNCIADNGKEVSES